VVAKKQILSYKRFKASGKIRRALSVLIVYITGPELVVVLTEHIVTLDFHFCNIIARRTS
jgi:ABC-type uncharacterized transport system ATPase component